MISERLSNFGGSIPNNEIHHITSTISHELRTPLNAIMGFSELIQEETSICEIKRFAKIIQDSGASLLGKIHSLIDYNIIDLCDEINIEEINLRTFIHCIWNEYKGQIENNSSIQFDVYFPEELDNLSLYSDSKKLRCILSHLLSNSIKFTQSGKIVIGVRKSIEPSENKESIQIYISDTGDGISTDSFSLVFKPFIHDFDIYASHHEGMGIGLAISQKLASKIGAKINFISCPGEGSTFYINIPALSLQNNLNSAKSIQVIGIIAEDGDTYLKIKDSLYKHSFKLIRILSFTYLENFLSANDCLKHIIICEPISNSDRTSINNLSHKFANHLFYLLSLDHADNQEQCCEINFFVFNSASISHGINRIIKKIELTNK